MWGKKTVPVSVSQTQSLYVMLPMLIVTQLVYSDPGLSSPLIEKASVLWCKPFL